MTQIVPQTDVVSAAARTAAREVLLLDVREDHEWVAGRAAQALHVPLSRLTADDVPGDRPVLVVCRVGGRSAQAAAALVGLGRDVTNVAGGMLAWEAAGLPVVTDAGPGMVV